MSTRRKYYAIRHLCELFECEERVIVQIVETEAVEPARVRSGEPQFDPSGVDQIRFALELWQELGVNLEGVEVALRMRRRMDELQAKLDAYQALFRRLADGT